MVRECYSCSKMVIKAHLHVGFITIFFIERASLKQFYLCMKLLQLSTIFKQKSNLEVSRLKFLHGIFYNSQFKSIIATPRIATTEQSELTFPLILYFYGYAI